MGATTKTALVAPVPRTPLPPIYVRATPTVTAGVAYLSPTGDPSTVLLDNVAVRLE